MENPDRNPNRPKPGSMIKVDPIKKLEDIDAIRKLLEHNPRDSALFTIGINTNLRASDLLRIKVKQVRGLKPKEELALKEKKTGKLRRITMNNACIQAIQRLLESRSFTDEDFLFTSTRTGGPLTVPSAHRMVKSWCRAINLKGNYGSHTLRKTWGYHQRVTYGVDIPRLMVCFNHSTMKGTLDYLCIQPDEIKDVYENEL